MTPLTDQLRAAVALPDIAIKDGHDQLLICLGEEQEHARLQPLLEKLIACVDALEAIIEESNKAKANGCVITNNCVRGIGDKALIALRAEVSNGAGT